MMEFMESMRRGVDRAGFEMDRFLRANRVRSRISSLRADAAEEERRIGQRVVELYLQGELAHQELAGQCERVKEIRAAVVDSEAELEAINLETPPEPQPEPLPQQRQVIRFACPNCGAVPPEGASFCPACGANLRPAPPEQATGQQSTTENGGG